MQPYTATDMLYVIKTEYSLDEPAAHALLKQSTSSDASPTPRRRLRGWVHSVFTLLF